MSIEVELNGKAGRVCEEARCGKIHCPLIVRQSSEDVLTGNVFGLLRFIRPHLWLGPLLNEGLRTNRFRQAHYKNLQIRLWERQERFPPDLLAFREGRTEPDIIIEWENPPTTVWIEAKYRSGLAEGTANNSQNDQVIRGVRTVLASTGHLQGPRLFEKPKREAVWLALLSAKPNLMVEHYRNISKLTQSLNCAPSLVSMPRAPFIGTITWGDIESVLKQQSLKMSSLERILTSRVLEYLSSKQLPPLTHHQ